MIPKTPRQAMMKRMSRTAAFVIGKRQAEINHAVNRIVARSNFLLAKIGFQEVNLRGIVLRTKGVGI